MNVRAFAVLLTAALLVSGCATTVAGDAIPGGFSRTPAKPPPFIPTIKERTNERTDGSSFEPCSAYTATELQTLDINPTSITDAAKVDSPNYRGCHWEGNDYTLRDGGTLYSQILGLEMTLAAYKRKLNTLPWQPDRIIHGRTVAVASENNGCTAVFRSEESIVTTRSSSTNPSPGLTAECNRAVAFASLAITKAP